MIDNINRKMKHMERDINPLMMEVKKKRGIKMNIMIVEKSVPITCELYSRLFLGCLDSLKNWYFVIHATSFIYLYLSLFLQEMKLSYPNLNGPDPNDWVPVTNNIAVINTVMGKVGSECG